MPRQPVERLRLTTRSVILAVAVVISGVVVIGVVVAAERVIGWLLLAAAIAGLLGPPVTWLDVHLPKGLAVAIVVVFSLGVFGVVTYAVISEVVTETRDLQESAPRLAEEIERSSDFAREFELAERTRQAVNDLPERLTGGPTGVFHTAAEGALTLSIVGILAVFFILQGPKLLTSAIAQLRDENRRSIAARALPAAISRAFVYGRRSLLIAVAAALLAYGLCRVAGLPAPAVLALWIGLWTVVPLVGTALGGVLAVGLAGIDTGAKAAAVAVAVVALQIGVEFARRRWAERGSVRVGPFMGAATVFVGVEFRGARGALLGLLGVALLLALIDEVAPSGDL